MFSNIVGNNRMKESLTNIISSENISHSYIFSGPDGIGKKQFAKQFAKAILCLDNDKKPCDKCKSCLEFDGSNNPDFFEIEPDGNSIKIEQIREMTKTVLEKPIVSNRKVYIVNESQVMTKEAQNSLLKTLEEPPEYVCIILVSSNENMFLNTIKSRCIKISFNKLTDEELRKVLNNAGEHIGFDKLKISDELIRIADGSITKAIELQDKEEIYSKLNKLFNKIENTNIIDLLNSKDEVFKEKEDAYNILEYINLIFFNLLKDNTQVNSKYIKCMEIIEQTKDRLRKNSNFDMTIDRMLIMIGEEING